MNKINKFWNFSVQNNERVLRLDGAISQDTWWGDEITPQIFRDELESGTGDIVVFVNSPGGDVFAASQIYTMLKEYALKSGKVTIKIDGLAASAASVIAMAGTEVLMSPVSYMVIHNPATIAIGDGEEMLRAKAMLDEIKEGIINAYESKTGLPRSEISRLMNEESCFNAKKAVELGFADDILYNENPVTNNTPVIFSRILATNSLLNKLPQKSTKGITAYDEFMPELENIKYYRRENQYE